ncbi:hypothetical protein JK364_46275 [Streptomyces sp. 110]|uniref:Transposase n=1 Tax=Streptomyces endocoffeicus TaxID=2898945 RepID=A0ABS1Q4R9_9ACTN|nr:hypothetical protein [Streptomyces endocoffeicus]MBL1119675.1 hypothetical protein [Streptomyces endocoffeicus]
MQNGHIISWQGFAAHVTETCASDRTNVITDVATTSAATNEAQALPGIHTRLARRGPSRYDRRDCIFNGTLAVAAIVIWLRDVIQEPSETT